MALEYYESPFHVTQSPEEADASILKTQLAILIRDVIEQENLTQTDAAQIMGSTQPRLSAIVNGKLKNVTLDCLFDMLARIGYETKLSIGNQGSPIIEFQKKNAA